MLAYVPACGARRPKEPAATPATPVAPSACGHDALAAASLAKILLPGGVHALQIKYVEKGSLLDKAGVRSGDVVKKLNGQPVGNADDVAKALTGGPVALDLERGKSPVTATVTCPPQSRTPGSN